MVELGIRSERLGVRYLPPLCCVLGQRQIYSPKSTGNEKLFTGTLNLNKTKTILF